MDKPMLAWHLDFQLNQDTKTSPPQPRPHHGHLLHQGQRWAETLELTLSKHAAVELHWLLFRSDLFCTRSKAGGHNLSYCSVANTWQTLTQH